VFACRTGPGAAASSPDCCAWSDDDYIAFGGEATLRVVIAGTRQVVCKLSGTEALADYDRAVQAVVNKRHEHQNHFGATLLSPQLATQPFTALSWGPTLATPNRGSLLCAAVAHACAVYARPAAPFEMRLVVAVQLTPLLHVALRHSPMPSAAERAAVAVHSSHWSRLLLWNEAHCEDVASGTNAALCYLALAGPALLVVVTHAPWAPVSSQWMIAISLRTPVGAAVVRLGPEQEASPQNHEAANYPCRLAVRTAALHLFSGSSDCGVIVWRLVPTVDTAAHGLRLRCSAARRVGCAFAITRRIASMSVSSVVEADSGVTSSCVVALASGPCLLLYRIEDFPRAIEGDATSDRMGKSPDATWESSLRLPPLGTLVYQAMHAHELTNVLCLGGVWYSAANDGTLLYGRLTSLPGEVHPVGALHYPNLGQLPRDRDATFKRDLGVVPAPKTAGLVSKVLNSTALSRGDVCSNFDFGADQDEDEVVLPSQSMVFGLAGSPSGGSLVICLRVLREGARTREMGRFDNWRLLVASFLPQSSRLPLSPFRASVEPVVPCEALEKFARFRPVGSSLWAVSASLMAECVAERVAFIEDASTTLFEFLRGAMSGVNQSSLRALQCMCALAHECGKQQLWCELERRVYDGSSGDKGISAPVCATEQSPRALEGESATHRAAHARALRSVGERCVKVLLEAQAASRVTVATAGAALASRTMTPPVLSAVQALPAADWLLAFEHEQQEPSRHRFTIRRCYVAARCVEGQAALEQKLPPPVREICMLCNGTVPVATTIEQCCAEGHVFARCWVCFKLLPLLAWTCSTCGAGACASHDADGAAGSVLGELSPTGVCGLCGSTCVPPTRALWS